MKAEILRQLETSVIGHRLHVFDEAGSTNDLAKERARSGGEEGEAFLALKQTAGRGRLGREWESPAGKNILLSVLLRPERAATEVSLITLVAGAAVFDLLASYVPNAKNLSIKWPNDVYWKDRKIAGILTESEADGRGVRWVVCGIGVDLNADVSDFSPEIRDRAASLKAILGRDTDLAQATARLLKFLETRYQDFLKNGPTGTLSFCDAHSYLKGRRVLFESPEGKLSGFARGLTPQGYLLVERQDGTVIPVVSGDVTVAEVA
jgi:BirA family transcriptional regulator, biotin operon repressor / biotin---[acetyl-CoA-carboxylase] ligase